MTIPFYFSYSQLDESIDNAVLYSVIFVNAVNRRFSTLTDPAIKLSFAGLLIGTVRLTCEYYNSMFIAPSHFNDTLQDDYTTLHIFKIGQMQQCDNLVYDCLPVSRSLFGLSRYLYNEERLNKSTFDVAIALTG